jgi:hypothetical protein
MPDRLQDLWKQYRDDDAGGELARDAALPPANLPDLSRQVAEMEAAAQADHRPATTALEAAPRQHLIPFPPIRLPRYTPPRPDLGRDRRPRDLYPQVVARYLASFVTPLVFALALCVVFLQVVPLFTVFNLPLTGLLTAWAVRRTPDTSEVRTWLDTRSTVLRAALPLVNIVVVICVSYFVSSLVFRPAAAYLVTVCAAVLAFMKAAAVFPPPATQKPLPRDHRDRGEAAGGVEAKWREQIANSFYQDDATGREGR